MANVANQRRAGKNNLLSPFSPKPLPALRLVLFGFFFACTALPLPKAMHLITAAINPAARVSLLVVVWLLWQVLSMLLAFN